MKNPYREVQKVWQEGAMGWLRWTQRMALVLLLVTFTFVPAGSVWLLGTLLFGYARGCALRPESPERCLESAEIIEPATSTRHCLGGGRSVTEVLPRGSEDYNPKVLFRCLCSSSDAGASEASK